jgi:hypothetical protein
MHSGGHMESCGHHVAPICHDYLTRCILFRVLVACYSILAISFHQEPACVGSFWFFFVHLKSTLKLMDKGMYQLHLIFGQNNEKYVRTPLPNPFEIRITLRQVPVRFQLLRKTFSSRR